MRDCYLTCIAMAHVNVPRDLPWLQVDMLVGDIYGGLDYPKIGLSSSTIASSFGRVVAGEWHSPRWLQSNNM